jgi:hypothetical protein
MLSDNTPLRIWKNNLHILDLFTVRSQFFGDEQSFVTLDRICEMLRTPKEIGVQSTSRIFYPLTWPLTLLGRMVVIHTIITPGLAMAVPPIVLFTHMSTCLLTH